MNFVEIFLMLLYESNLVLYCVITIFYSMNSLEYPVQYRKFNFGNCAVKLVNQLMVLFWHWQVARLLSLCPKETNGCLSFDQRGQDAVISLGIFLLESNLQVHCL